MTRWRSLSIAVAVCVPSLLTAQYVRPGTGLLVAETALFAAVIAGSDHWLDSPEKWNQDLAGYRRRLDVRATQFTLATAAEVTLFSLSNADPRYRPCRDCGQAGRRLRHIVAQTFTVQRSPSARGPAWQVVTASLVGAAGSAPLLPPRYRTSWVLTRPLTALAARGVLFTWYEFAPRAMGGRRAPH
jgi:hypothetical protein